MEIKYNDFLKIAKKYDFKYFNTGLPFGAIRVYSKDNKGVEHSLVLTHKEFVKEFGRNIYFYKVVTDGAPEIRLNNVHSWQEYEDYEKVQNQLKEKEENIMRGIFD